MSDLTYVYATFVFAAVLAASIASSSNVLAAKSKSAKEWDTCVKRAEASVNQQEVGVWGVEAAVKEQCGEPPIVEPSGVTGVIGISPYNLVRSKAWRAKFKALTKGKYGPFVNRLVVAGETRLEGSWVVGSGIAPHEGGTNEAAFAINAKSGEVFGAMLEDGKMLVGFGFGSSWKDAPPFLQQWANDR